MHEYYEPNETEQMFIAAGWISEADVDLDYQDYLRNQGDEFTMSYQSWLNTKRDLDELNATYEAEITPVYRNCSMGEDMDFLTPEFNRREQHLLKEMSYLEQALGY